MGKATSYVYDLGILAIKEQVEAWRKNKTNNGGNLSNGGTSNSSIEKN